MTRQGEARERTLENVQEFWASEADSRGDDHPMITIRDHFYRLAEINLFRNMLHNRRVLDAGCGTGWSSAFYAAVAKSLVGFDITEGLIGYANQMLADRAFRRKWWEGLTPWGAPALLNNMTFEVQDVLDLPYDAGAFDAVVCQRLLINLPTWEMQQQALENLIKVLMPGGVLLISEVTEDGHGCVNALRRAFGLGPLETYWHNQYLHHEQFMAELEKHALNTLGPGCLDVYGFLSKVVYPAMAYPEEPQFMSGFNLAAAMVSQFYPDSSHLNMGLYSFMDETFRGALAFYWPDVPWVEAYDAILTRVVGLNIDATAIRGCNHQTIYVAEVK